MTSHHGATTPRPPRPRLLSRGSWRETQRIAGILRNAGDARVSAEPPAELAPEERDLVKRLAEFPTVVAEATERRGPHALPNYAIRVADDFHRFYHEHKVLGSETEAFRLALVRAAQVVVARGLDLVGVVAPQRV